MRSLKINNNYRNSDSVSIMKYFNDVNKYDTLTAEEESELGVLIKSDKLSVSEKAKEKLIKHNLRFVISVAKQYQIKGLALEDLINEGNLGLIKASENFDPSKGFKFISYAVWSIRQHILAYISKSGRAIKLPIQKTTKMLKIKQNFSLLEQKLGREPSDYELKESLLGEISNSDFNFYLNYKTDTVSSYDVPMSDENNNTKLDYLKDNDEATFEIDGVNKVDKILSLLNNERESDILKLLYGLNDEEPKTINEIAEMYGVSYERIRNIKSISLRKLKVKLKNDVSWVREM